MKRTSISFLVLIAALAFASFAAAQTTTPCAGVIASPAVPVTPDATFTFKCTPHDIGGLSGSYPRLAHNGTGWVAWNYCTDGFTYGYQFGVVTDEYLAGTPEMVVDWAALQFVTDPVEQVTALNAFAAKYMTVPITDPTLASIWCPSVPAMVAGKPGPVPYIVTPDPKGATYRATYLTSKPINGIRTAQTVVGKVSIKNADGSAHACNCLRARTVEGAVTFCAPDDQSQAVTNCTRQ